MVEPVLLAVALTSGQSAQTNTAADVHSCWEPVSPEKPTVESEEVRWMTSLPLTLMTPLSKLLGRRLSLRDIRVDQVDERGFWIGTGVNGCRLYVRPAEGRLIQVTPGERIDLQGEFRFRVQPGRLDGAGTTAYVYAYIVRKAPVP